MKRIYKILLCTIALMAVGPTLLAQEWRSDTLYLDIKFRNASSEIEPDYRDNAVNIEAFRSALEAYLQDTSAVVNTISVRTSASPAGKTDYNRKLSRERAEAIGVFLTRKLGLDSSLFDIQSIGEDWDGLARLVAKLDVPWRDKVLKIINGTKAPEKGEDPRKQRLRDMDKAAYLWMYENLYPELRAAGGSVACLISVPEPVAETELESQETPAPAEKVSPAPIEVHVSDTVNMDGVNDIISDYALETKKMLMALRTNALAIPLANIGVEVPIGDTWSIGADWYYPWLWRKHHSEGVDYLGWCVESLALNIEGRYWFGERSREQLLLGHSSGLFAMAGYYDFERNFKGLQGEFATVGVDYLYAMPVFRDRMHLEFSLGVGYFYSQARDYEVYTPGGKGYKEKDLTKVIQYFGPVKATVSLVVPIYFTKKGGAE